MKRALADQLARAWNWRQERGCLEGTECLRVFHGPGEGGGALARWAVDLFSGRAWVTEWESQGRSDARADALALDCIAEFLVSRGVASAVVLRRPEKGVPAEPQALIGAMPLERFAASEGRSRFWIQLHGTRHPGLFLDHLPLRRWLEARARGWKVLNTFAYTGSLSVSAALGGATHVTTLDLSKPTIRWAQDNWELNTLPLEKSRFIAGDVFEWLPRLKREGERYDAVILDPPSFSRGNKGSFSTSRDLPRLHRLAMELIEPGGILITSINSANVGWGQYEKDVLSAARELRLEFDILSRIDQPETFPSALSDPQARYLKGWVLRMRA